MKEELQTNFTDVREKMRVYLIDLMKHVRERINSLPAELQATISQTPGNFLPPCQIMVIWAKEPEFQIIIITRLEELNDGFINIHGPIENFILPTYIETQILNSDFVKFVGRDMVEGFLVGALKAVRYYYDPLTGPPKPTISYKITMGLEKPYTTKSYLMGWLVIGNLLKLDLEKIVEECINDIAYRVKSSSLTSVQEDKTILEGFGAYIYPPVWIGEPPKPRTFREKVFEPPIWKYSTEIIIKDVYKGFPLIALREGYIAIDTKEKAKALEFLNEIVATLLLLGIPVHVIKEADVGEAVFKEKSARWGPDRLRSWQYHLPFHIFSSLSARETIISEGKMRNAIKLAELLTTDERVRTLISLFHEAYTYFMNTEYKQALIMSWVILEDFYIEDLLSSTISKITSDKKRLEKIENWNIDQKIEVLNISHVISNEEYDLLMEIKKARNDVVHEGKAPGKEIVEKCLNLASRVVQRYIGTYFGELLPKLF
jgi:hypothetical protein